MQVRFQMEHIMAILTDNSIFLNKKPPDMTFEKTGSGGIQVFFLTNSAKKSVELLDELVEEHNFRISTRVYEIARGVTDKVC